MRCCECKSTVGSSTAFSDSSLPNPVSGGDPQLGCPQLCHGHPISQHTGLQVLPSQPALQRSAVPRPHCSQVRCCCLCMQQAPSKKCDLCSRPQQTQLEVSRSSSAGNCHCSCGGAYSMAWKYYDYDANWDKVYEVWQGDAVQYVLEPQMEEYLEKHPQVKHRDKTGQFRRSTWHRGDSLWHVQHGVLSSWGKYHGGCKHVGQQ